MTKTRKSIITGAIAISFSAMLWGMDGIVLTPRLYNLEVSYVVFILHALPFLIMNIFFFREYKNIKNFSRSDVIFLLLLAIFGGAIGTISIVKALFLLNFKKLTIVVLLQKLQPVFAISLAALLLKEKIRPTFLLWAALAIIAGYFMTFGLRLPDLDAGANTIYASLLALLAAFSFGSSTVFSKKILQRYNFKTATFYRYGITALLMFLVVSISGNLNQFLVTTPKNWLFFLIIAFTSGSGAIFLFYYGLNKVKAIVATICELFFPITAVLLDYFVNHTILSWVQWLSAAIMIFAIINLNAYNTKVTAK